MLQKAVHKRQVFNNKAMLGVQAYYFASTALYPLNRGDYIQKLKISSIYRLEYKFSPVFTV